MNYLKYQVLKFNIYDTIKIKTSYLIIDKFI